MASIGYRLTWDRATYEWHGMSSLTASRLRHFKQWYGSDYGKAATFNLLFLQGDVDAVGCVIWALLKEAKDRGENVRVPNTPNELPEFSVGTFMDSASVIETAEEEVPLETEAVTPTPDSTRTSTSSEDDTSALSASSARSARAK